MNFCAYCGQKATLRCTRCRIDMFCNRDCQIKHYKLHKGCGKSKENAASVNETAKPQQKVEIRVSGPSSNANSESSSESEHYVHPRARAIAGGRPKSPIRSVGSRGIVPLYGEGYMDWLDEVAQDLPDLMLNEPSCGFINAGNTCYLNAALQALACTPSLHSLLQEARHLESHDAPRDCFLCAFEKVSKELVRSSKPINPHWITEMTRSKMFGDSQNHNAFGGQADAQECLGFLLELMQEAIIPRDGRLLPAEVEELERSSMIGHLFSFDIGQSVYCRTCSKENIKESVDYYLRLEITTGMSCEELARLHNSSGSLFGRKAPAVAPCDVKDLIEHFLRPEPLADYKCEGCNRRGTCEKRTNLLRLPNILIVLLDQNKSTGMWGKVNREVSCPSLLKLSDCEYALYAMIVHLDLGGSTFFGHYVCFVRGNRGDWWLCDDEEIIRVSSDYVERQQPLLVLYQVLDPIMEPPTSRDDARAYQSAEEEVEEEVEEVFSTPRSSPEQPNMSPEQLNNIQAGLAFASKLHSLHSPHSPQHSSQSSQSSQSEGESDEHEENTEEEDESDALHYIESEERTLQCTKEHDEILRGMLSLNHEARVIEQLAHEEDEDDDQLVFQLLNENLQLGDEEGGDFIPFGLFDHFDHHHTHARGIDAGDAEEAEGSGVMETTPDEKKKVTMRDEESGRISGTVVGEENGRGGDEGVVTERTYSSAEERVQQQSGTEEESEEEHECKDGNRTNEGNERNRVVLLEENEKVPSSSPDVDVDDTKTKDDAESAAAECSKENQGCGRTGEGKEADKVGDAHEHRSPAGYVKEDAFLKDAQKEAVDSKVDVNRKEDTAGETTWMRGKEQDAVNVSRGSSSTSLNGACVERKVDEACVESKQDEAMESKRTSSSTSPGGTSSSSLSDVTITHRKEADFLVHNEEDETTDSKSNINVSKERKSNDMYESKNKKKVQVDDDENSKEGSDSSGSECSIGCNNDDGNNGNRHRNNSECDNALPPRGTPLWYYVSSAIERDEHCAPAGGRRKSAGGTKTKRARARARRRSEGEPLSLGTEKGVNSATGGIPEGTPSSGIDREPTARVLRKSRSLDSPKLCSIETIESRTNHRAVSHGASSNHATANGAQEEILPLDCDSRTRSGRIRSSSDEDPSRDCAGKRRRREDLEHAYKLSGEKLGTGIGRRLEFNPKPRVPDWEPRAKYPACRDDIYKESHTESYKSGFFLNSLD